MEEKPKFCEFCGNKIEQGEEFCTKCGKKVGETSNINIQNTLSNQKNNQKMPVWAVVLIIFCSVFIICLIFYSDDEPELSSEPNFTYDESESNSTNNSELESTKKEYKRNETVIYKGARFSVTNVKYSNGTSWDKPAKGKNFVIVTIKIENTSNEKLSYNVYDWKMKNSQGQEDEETFTTVDNDTNLHSGTLSVGGKKEGTIVFEEPKNDKSLKLLYFDNALFDDEEAFAILIK